MLDSSGIRSLLADAQASSNPYLAKSLYRDPDSDFEGMYAASELDISASLHH